MRAALRVLLCCCDNGGHLTCTIGLARALAKFGHVPLLLAAPSAAGMIEQAGVTFVPFAAYEETDIGAAMTHARARVQNVPAVPAWAGRGLGLFVEKRERELRFRRVVLRVAESTARAVASLVGKLEADVVIGETFSFGAAYGAMLAKVPFASLGSDPSFSLDAEGRPLLLPDPRVRKIPAELWRRLVDSAVPMKRVRRRLGLSAQTFTGELYASSVSLELNLVVAPPGFTGVDHIPSDVFVGPLAYAPPGDGRTVDVDKATVLVTGSTTGHPRGVAALRRTIDALAGSTLKVVVAAGPLRGYVPPAAPNVTVIDGVADHDELSARAGVVVTHGGWGTTGRVLRAGTPLVVTPAFGPQPFIGERVAALNLGVTLNADAISRPALEAACERAMNDISIRRETASMRALLYNLDSARVATRAVESLVAHSRVAGLRNT